MAKISIEDRLDINDLFVRYTCAIDAGDVETLIGCFAEDGSLESPAVGTYAGRPAIRESAQRFARFRQNGSQLRHVISNLLVDVQGNRGKATCYLTVFISKNGASRLLAPGYYECDLVKVDGAWLFKKRIVHHDHSYTLEGI